MALVSQVGLSSCQWNPKLQVSCEADKLSKGPGTLRSWPMLLSVEVTSSKWQKSGYLTLDTKRKHTMTQGDTEWQGDSHIYTCSVCGWICDIFFFLFIKSLSKCHAKQSTTHADTYTPAGRKLMRLAQAAPVPPSGLVTFLIASTIDLTKTAGGRKEFFVLWFEEIWSSKRKPL